MRDVRLDALVRASRTVNAPPDDARERNRVLLAQRIALGVAAGAAASGVRPATAAVSGAGGAAPAAGGAMIGWLGKWTVMSIVIAVGGIGVAAFVARGPHPGPADQVAPGAASPPPQPLAPDPAPDPQATLPPVVDTASPAASPGHLDTQPRARQEPSAAPDGPSLDARNLDRELQLVRSAQRALDSGSPAQALALVDRHAAEFPHGVLNQECQAVRILALCASGRVASAQDARDRFLKQHPGSPLADRVRATCGGGH